MADSLWSKSISEQKAILEKQESRHMLDRVRDDSSSLMVLRDTASFLTKGTWSTDDSSKLSRVFPSLDAELMRTPVYQRAVRSLFGRSKRRNSRSNGPVGPEGALDNPKVPELKEQASRSETIDTMLKQHERFERNEIQLAMLGTSEVMLENLVTCLRQVHGPHPNTNIRLQICSSLEKSIKTLARVFESDVTPSQRGCISEDIFCGKLCGQVESEAIATMASIWAKLSKKYSRSKLASIIEPSPVGYVFQCFTSTNTGD